MTIYIDCCGCKGLNKYNIDIMIKALRVWKLLGTFQGSWNVLESYLEAVQMLYLNPPWITHKRYINIINTFIYGYNKVK